MRLRIRSYVLHPKPSVKGTIRVVNHAVVSIEQRVAAWRIADEAARKAEREARSLGPGSIDLWIHDRARELRLKADRQLSALLRAVPLEEMSDSA
jgi:hypothetical protein